MKEGDKGSEEEVFKKEIKEATHRLEEAQDTWREEYDSADNGRKQKMSGFNRVVLMGRLTRDPQLRKLPSGTAVAAMGLAINETYKKQDGEVGQTVCFVDIEAWGRQAEACGEYLTKGRDVLVEGGLHLDRWETSDGQKRSKLRVRAKRVQFLNDGKRKDGSSAPEPVREPAMAAESREDDPMPFGS